MAKNTVKKILFRTAGGLGKQILSTRIAKLIRENNPNAIIHVQTSYPEMYANLDFIDRYFALKPIPYFYNDHIDFDVMETEIYTDLKYRQGKSHALETWANRFGYKIKKDEIGGIIQLDENEKIAGNQFIMQNKIDVSKLIAFQPFGGTSYYNPNDAQNVLRVKQARDLPLEKAQEIANLLIEEGYTVLQISLPTEQKLNGCIHLPDTQNVLNPRFVISIINNCRYGIFIDSFAQHAWKALGKKDAIVLWGATNPKSLGYDTNINLTTKKCDLQHCNRPNTWLGDYTGNDNIWKCLYNKKCMDFDAKTVVDSLLQTVKDNDTKSS